MSPQSITLYHFTPKMILQGKCLHNRPPFTSRHTNKILTLRKLSPQSTTLYLLTSQKVLTPKKIYPQTIDHPLPLGMSFVHHLWYADGRSCHERSAICAPSPNGLEAVASYAHIIGTPPSSAYHSHLTDGRGG